MGFQEAVKQGIEIVKLNRGAMRLVAADPEAFSQGLIITAIVGLAAWLEPTTFTPWGIIGHPLLALFWLFVSTAVFHFVAILFGAHGDYMSLLRVFGVGRVLGWIVVVPWIGRLVFGVWTLVIAVVALEELYGLDRTKAVICVLLPTAVLIFLGLLVVTLFVSIAGLPFFFGV